MNKYDFAAEVIQAIKPLAEKYGIEAVSKATGEAVKWIMENYGTEEE